MMDLLTHLIRCPSITPDDAGCQSFIAQRLSALGFQITSLPSEGVQNLWAQFGTQKPLFVFAGHTDVVPPGPLDAWNGDPFIPMIQDGVLYGRGAADMKSGIAAMVVAVERLLQRSPALKGSIAFLLTSDEEGPALHGTQHVLRWLKEHNITIDYCIVGEASSHLKVGDEIKCGHRGSMTGHLKIFGKQGHVAHPDKAKNAVHETLPILLTLVQEKWDKGNKDFQPTSFQISNIRAGTGAGNVIPGVLECMFNFRFNTEVSPETLQKKVHDILDKASIEYELHWEVSGLPFMSKKEKLTQICQEVIQEITGSAPLLSTTGGTSDARFIVPTGTETIELGPVNATIHKANECVSIHELEMLSQMYERIVERLLSGT